MTLVEELKELLKKKKYAVSYAAKAINVSNATLHLWMNNNYKGNVKKIDDAVANFIEIEKLREGRIRVDFVRTSIVDDVFDIAKTCHVENEIGVCCGDAGIGKTYAVKRYAIDNTDVILIEADLGYTPKVLFSEIHKKLGFDGCGTIHGMFLDIIDKLKSSGRLIIIDEAEHLPYKSLELLRRIYDKAQVGILLVGMPRLIMNLKGEKKEIMTSLIKICMHWTAGSNNPCQTDIDAYHFIFDSAGKEFKGKFAPEDNINCYDGKYAKHCGGGNTGCIGLSCCGMAGFDLKNKQTKYPITKKQVEAICCKAAKLCIKYGIQVTAETVFTHYEFDQKRPAEEREGKSDIAYLPYLPNLSKEKAGDFLRNKISWYITQTKKGKAL